jgi:hypothetical protein
VRHSTFRGAHSNPIVQTVQKSIPDVRQWYTHNTLSGPGYTRAGAGGMINDGTCSELAVAVKGSTGSTRTRSGIPAKDAADDDSGNHVVVSSLGPSAEELGWCITWTLAFPTLLTSFRFGSREDGIVWQRLALHVIFGSSMTESMGRSAASMTPTFSLPTTSTAPFSWTHSLGYGEICLNTVLRILQRIPHPFGNHQDQDLNGKPQKALTVADLGSGNGKVLLTAALGLSVGRAIGIEIAPSLHAQAVINYEEHWKYWDADCSAISTSTTDSTTGSTTCNGSTTDWEWKCSDFTEDTEWVELVDLIFIHATVFEKALMDQLNVLCQGCRSGTYFCMVSQPLNTTSCSDGAAGSIETIDEVHLDMNWGQATVYLQRKK